MSEYFLWFFLIVVTSANSHSTNITYKFTTTGDLCCPGTQQQEEVALDEKGRIALLGLINNTKHFDARNDSNGTDGTEVEVKCFVSVLQLDQTEVGRPDNKAKVQGRSHSNEIEKGFSQTYEGLIKCSCLVCFVADIRDILTFRCKDTHSDDKYRYDESDAQRICEKVCENSKYDRQIKSCAYAFVPTAPISKVEDGYLGNVFRQFGGTSVFVILFSIFVMGFFLNCILIRIFRRHEKMRKDSKLIIINIAVADMLSLFLYSPPIYNFLVNFIHSPLSVTYVFYMIVGLNIYSVMMFSCYIYLTELPNRNRRNSGYSGTKRYSPHAHALTAAFLACLVPIPLISCIEDYYTVSLYVLVAYCVVPLCCSALFSVGASLQLGSCVQSVHCESSDDDALRGPWSNSAKTSVALIVVSAISYVPYFSLPFIPQYMEEDSDVHSFLISWVFVCFNSLMNPIALYVSNRNFRYYFNNYICFCCYGGRE